jgi:hypothetical protein
VLARICGDPGYAEYAIGEISANGMHADKHEDLQFFDVSLWTHPGQSYAENSFDVSGITSDDVPTLASQDPKTRLPFPIFGNKEIIEPQNPGGTRIFQYQDDVVFASPTPAGVHGHGGQHVSQAALDPQKQSYWPRDQPLDKMKASATGILKSPSVRGVQQAIQNLGKQLSNKQQESGHPPPDQGAHHGGASTGGGGGPPTDGNGNPPPPKGPPSGNGDGGSGRRPPNNGSGGAGGGDDPDPNPFTMSFDEQIRYIIITLLRQQLDGPVGQALMSRGIFLIGQWHALSQERIAGMGYFANDGSFIPITNQTREHIERVTVYGRTKQLEDSTFHWFSVDQHVWDTFVATNEMDYVKGRKMMDDWRAALSQRDFQNALLASNGDPTTPAPAPPNPTPAPAPTFATNLMSRLQRLAQGGRSALGSSHVPPRNVFVSPLGQVPAPSPHVFQDTSYRNIPLMRPRSNTTSSAQPIPISHHQPMHAQSIGGSYGNSNPIRPTPRPPNIVSSGIHPIDPNAYQHHMSPPPYLPADITPRSAANI